MRRKSAIFWSKLSKRCLKTPFLVGFFKILIKSLSSETRKFNQNGFFKALGELGNQIGRAKKRSITRSS